MRPPERNLWGFSDSERPSTLPSAALIKRTAEAHPGGSLRVRVPCTTYPAKWDVVTIQLYSTPRPSMCCFLVRQLGTLSNFRTLALTATPEGEA